MARTWVIDIPVRPKAVQSVRFGGGMVFPDKKVRKWKEAIRPFIRACSPGRPTAMPVRVKSLRYVFKLPKSAKKAVREYVAAGGTVPYLVKADVSDNLAKGLMDVCTGIVFTDDRLVWRVAETEKVYGLRDGIHVEFEETPDVVLVDGSNVPSAACAQQRA